MLFVPQYGHAICLSIWSGHYYLFQALEGAGVIPGVRGVAGCSIGAVMAGLVAVGYTAQEVATMFSTDLKALFAGNQIELKETGCPN